MVEAVDEHFVESIRGLARGTTEATVDADVLLGLFDAQAQSRHLDLAARWLQAQGQGFYTIGSAGHEANAALGLLTRVDDPALLHYRSGGFYAARAARHAHEHPRAATDAIRDVLLGLTASAADPSGGRHKVFGHPDLHVIPQTSTIGSHLPRAVGLAYALGNLADLAPRRSWPGDAIVVCSIGDASVNHATVQGALNAAAYLTHRGLQVPLLVVCEDNGLGISTRTPPGWVAAALRGRPGIGYAAAPSPRPDQLLADVGSAVGRVRATRSPTLLHLSTVRYLGHAGSDVELGYRSRAEITADLEHDPLLATAGQIVEQGVLTPDAVLDRYEAIRAQVSEAARSVIGEPRLADRAAVLRPLAEPRPQPGLAVGPTADGRPEGRLTLAQSLNSVLAEVLSSRPHALVFGQDVAVKGGVYGVTRGLRKRFGGRRVFDTLLDEQTILGTALGAGLAGLLPIPEIQYLAYLHNAEDQLRGEAASLGFFSDGRYRNPMVVRVAGLAYQKGFGGHFHNDNSLAVLRDVPGLVLCVPSHPADAPPLVRACVQLAEREGRVCVVVEPIALYHARDLHEPGDDLWTAPYAVGGSARGPRRHGDGRDLLMITFGNGVPMSLRVARALEQDGLRTSVLDLRWLSPLPVDAVAETAGAFDRVLVVDETRASGGVGEGVVAGLVEQGYAGRLGRVASADSFVPLGPAAAHVLLGEHEILASARSLLRQEAAHGR